MFCCQARCGCVFARPVIFFYQPGIHSLWCLWLFAQSCECVTWHSLLQHMQTTSMPGKASCLEGQVSEQLACIAHGHWPGCVQTQDRRRQLTALLQLAGVRGSRKATGCLACCAGCAKLHQRVDPWLPALTVEKPWSASPPPLPATVPVRTCSMSDKA